MNDFDVAIIGMSGRFPGAKDIASFWQNLRNGSEGISFFTDQEMEVYVDPEDAQKPNFVKAKGVIEDVDMFDAAFFNISDREAEWMDPQQRVFLQGAWEALEHAGYNPLTYAGQIAVYAGVNTNTYLLERLAQLQAVDPASYLRILLSNEKDHLATRVSYKLDLRGESLTVQTSCSTSLVAVHLAYQSVLSGQSDMALAGGISIRVPQKVGYFYQEGMVASPDGHCRPFDADAKGTVPGHGFGIVVLKALQDALRDGDTVHAIIKGSAINNDGHHKVGYTAPSVAGQADVVRRALAMAGVSAGQITFVEAHGTGTPLGDPIEVEALSRVFREQTQKKQYCVIGAVKSMIGHLDNAAGVAGLIKTILALKHREIPPTLHFKKANPLLDLENTPFKVSSTLVNWETASFPRLAGVSSFGIGGTNVHLILEEAPPSPEPESSGRPQILTLSARSAAALEDMTARLIADLRQDPSLAIEDVAYTQNIGRHSFQHRRYTVGSSTKEILDDLVSRVGNPSPSSQNGRLALAFLFPGQGALRPGLTSELYASESGFRQPLDECASFVRATYGIDLQRHLYAHPGDPGSTDDPAIALPSLFAAEYALARLWMAWGIRPQALLGHSFGEYVAACLAGVFTPEDGLRLAVARGRLIRTLKPGAMTSVRLPAGEAEALLAGQLAVAAVNSRRDCTLSGPLPAIESLEQNLLQKQIGYRRVDVPYAYHSSMIDPILDEFGATVGAIPLRRPALPLVSSLSGTWIDAEEITAPAYWVKQMRGTVRFAQALETLGMSYSFLEISPAPVLVPLLRQHFQNRDLLAVSSIEASVVKKGEQFALRHALGRLWEAGAEPDWKVYYQEEKRRRVPLPTYPFERRRHWVDARRPAAPSANKTIFAEKEPARSGLQQVSEERGSMAVRRTDSRPRSSAPPRNEIEQVLVQLWTEVLGQSDIDISDSFFALGGDSLTAAQVYARLRQVVAVDVTLEQMFSASTIAELSRLLQRQIKRDAGLRCDEQDEPYRWVLDLPVGEDGEQATLYATEDELHKMDAVEAEDEADPVLRS